jgi:WD40 repeat protein
MSDDAKSEKAEAASEKANAESEKPDEVESQAAEQAEAVKADPTKTHVAETLKHTSPLIACRFDPTGKFVFAGAEDGRVWRFTLEGGAKTEFAGHESWIRAIAFSPDGKTLVTGGYDGRLAWSAADAESPAENKPVEPLRAMEAHDGWIRAIAVSPDGALLASVGNDLVVRLCNMSDGAPIAELRGHESHIYNVAFHPAGKHLVSGDLKGNFLVWELQSSKELRRFAEPLLHKYDPTFWADIGGPRGMAFNGDGTLLAACGITNVSNAFAGVGNPTVVVFDWSTGERKIQHLGKGDPRGTAWGVAFHPDGFTIAASGGSGGFLHFWKPDEKEDFHQVKLPDTGRDLALHPDGITLATCHANQTLVISKMLAKA